MLPRDVIRCLRSRRFPIGTEKQLQEHVAAALAEDGIAANREERLGGGDIIDFLVDGIGIEIKIKGQRRAILAQCERYCEHESIAALILLTAAAMGFPAEINGKTCTVISLGRAWL